MMLVHVKYMNIFHPVRTTIQIFICIVIAILPISQLESTPHLPQSDATGTVAVRTVHEQAFTVFGHSYNMTQYRTKSSTFTLTAYNLDDVSTGKKPGDPGFGVTATGTQALCGRTVAVDPRVIPYGSLLYIKGVGWRVAEDTGGAIRGHHIDVLMNNRSVAMKFGVKRNCKVQIFVHETPVTLQVHHSMDYS